MTATVHFCRKRVFMLRLVPEVHRIIRHCHPCQIKTQKAPVQKDVHRPSVQAGAPFQVWSMDILGPLRASSEGNRYLLTLKDVFSKWFEAIPLNRTTSEKVLRALQMLFSRFGHPLQVHTDNATYFRSHLMQEAFRRAGIRLTFTPTYNPQSNSVERVHRDLNAMMRALCNQHAADWEEVLPAALLALRSAVHESTGVTPFACVYGKEPATPLDLISRPPGAPLAAHSYVRRLEEHQFRAHRAVQTQLARALQRSARRYGDEKDAIQPGERVWLFTSKPAADRKLAIPYTGPWRVIQQLSGTLRTIRPEGNWCTQPKTITVSLNRLKRCRGEEPAIQRVDFDLSQLEDVDDDAEGPMRNAWITADGSAATRALNQEVGDVHAPSLRERRAPATVGESAMAPRLTVHSRDMEGVAPSLVVHHEHTNVVSPSDLSGSAHRSFSRADSATMTAPETSAALIRPEAGPLSQTHFDRSVAVRLHSSQAGDERTLPPVSEMSHEEAPSPSLPTSDPSSATPAVSPSLPPSHRSSSAATAGSTSLSPRSSSAATTGSASLPAPASTRDTTLSDYGPEEQRGVKRAPSAGSVYSQLRRTYPAGPTNYPKRPGRPYFDFDSDSEDDAPPPPERRPGRSRSPDSDYSREHRASSPDRHRYPKRHLRNRIAAILGRGHIFSLLTLFMLFALFSRCPSAAADRMMSRNSYGLVEERYHLTAYDCSDPSGVQAYSSIPARPCSVRTTPVHQARPSRFQLLQREKKRYVVGYVCSLTRTDIRYNCGVYGHSELDPMHWSFSVPQRVSIEDCRAWLRTRIYRPGSTHSTLMHGPPPCRTPPLLGRA